jgi:hypothetical protein
MDMYAALMKIQTDLAEMKEKSTEILKRVEALEAEEVREKSFGRKKKEG